MKKGYIVMTAVACVMAVGCGTVQKAEVVKEAPQPVVVVPQVEASPEVLSIVEAMALLEDVSKAPQALKAKGYSYKKAYKVYRLDKYENLYYKNCRLPKQIREGVYEDMPKPLRKGVSSYVAVTDRVEIGVFNDKAFQNLVDQVKSAGFRLDIEGYEDKYTNDVYNIFCYKTGKRVRIEKLNR